jgi:hypothetical protein
LAIYLYCLLRAARKPPAHLLGIDGAPVRTIDLGGFGAWVSDFSEATVAPSPDRARSHDRVVRAVLDEETPLPARFGQVVATEADLTQVVSSRRIAFESALQMVAGTVEMTVRVLLPSSAEAVETDQGPSSKEAVVSGRSYLQRVAAVQRQERNLLAEGGIVRERVNSAVGDLVRAESFAGATSGSTMATVSHLVPRENVHAYRSALLVLRDAEPALAIMVSGPWAPYSFTEIVGA